MSHLNKVKFDRIRYANCWEDADRLLVAMGKETGRKILSIASGGDNSFSLLITDPELVVAVDVSPTQLYLVELKKEAIRLLAREDYLKFVGFKKTNESQKRKLIYQQIRPQLTDEAKRYWDSNLSIIKTGLVHCGKFEIYLRSFGKKILPLIHSKTTVEELFAEKSAEAQINFFNKKWNSIRWRMLFKIFFSRFVLGRFGRDPKFMKQVEISVSEYLSQKTKEHFSSTHCQKNWMLQYILRGDFGINLPHYVLPGNYEHIQKNIDKLELWQGFAQDATEEFGKFDGFNLSNIFEYMDTDTFANVSDGLLKSASPNAKFAYWNLMVPRNLSEQVDFNFTTQKEWTNFDKGFFYRDFILNEKVGELYVVNTPSVRR